VRLHYINSLEAHIMKVKKGVCWRGKKCPCLITGIPA
jgi:hypothetical protein